MRHERQGFTLDEIERLIFHMPTIARLATDDFARGFAASIVKQARRKGWHPSPKQLPIMRELVSDLFRHGLDDTDGEVLE